MLLAPPKGGIGLWNWRQSSSLLSSNLSNLNLTVRLGKPVSHCELPSWPVNVNDILPPIRVDAPYQPANTECFCSPFFLSFFLSKRSISTMIHLQLRYIFPAVMFARTLLALPNRGVLFTDFVTPSRSWLDVYTLRRVTDPPETYSPNF